MGYLLLPPINWSKCHCFFLNYHGAVLPHIKFWASGKKINLHKPYYFITRYKTAGMTKHISVQPEYWSPFNFIYQWPIPLYCIFEKDKKCILCYFICAQTCCIIHPPPPFPSPPSQPHFYSALCISVSIWQTEPTHTSGVFCSALRRMCRVEARRTGGMGEANLCPGAMRNK